MTALTTHQGDAVSASALNLAPVAILVAEPDGSVTDVNRAWTQLSGLDHRASVSRGWLTLIAPEDQTRVLRTLADARPETPPVVGDYRIQVAGRHHWSRWIAHRFSDEPLIVVPYWTSTPTTHASKPCVAPRPATA